MSMVSSVIRRGIRAHLLRPTIISRGIRRSRFQSSVRDDGIRVWLSEYQGIENSYQGAEKSCLKRRRKRGLRIGSPRLKRGHPPSYFEAISDRSRGGNPPQISDVPAPDSKIPSSRSMTRLLRQMDYWDAHLQTLTNRVREVLSKTPDAFFYQAIVDGMEKKVLSNWYLSVCRRYHALLSAVKKGAKGVEFAWLPFGTWMEKEFRFVVPGDVKAVNAFLRMVSGRNSRVVNLELWQEFQEGRRYVNRHILDQFRDYIQVAQNISDEYRQRASRKRTNRLTVANAHPSQGSPVSRTRAKAKGRSPARGQASPIDCEPIQWLSASGQLLCSACGGGCLSMRLHGCWRQWSRRNSGNK